MKSLALLALTLAAVQQPTLLRRTFTADTIDTYKIEDRVDQTSTSALGQVPMTIVSSRTYALKTTTVDAAAGTARFEATTTVDKLDVTGPASGAMGQKPKPFTQKGKIDLRGRMVFDPAASTDALATLMSGTQGTVAAGTFVELPERTVKVGDSWDVVVPKAPFLYDGDQHLTATLTGERTVDGAPAWVVAIKGTVKTDVDTSKLPSGKGVETPMGTVTVHLKGQVDLAGEGLVDKATGKTLSMTTKGVTKTTIDLVETGISLETTGTIESTAKLQK